MTSYQYSEEKNPHNDNVIYCKFCGKRLKWKYHSEHIDYHNITYCKSDYTDIFQFNPEKGEDCIPECYDETMWTPKGDKHYGMRKCSECRRAIKECWCDEEDKE